MKYLQIILNLPINQPFTYSYIPDQKEKEELVPQIGKRAEIMFGNRKTTGFIVDILDEVPPTCPVEKGKIRPIKRILDKEPLFQKELIELAKWISHYYLCTFGEAVFAMIPSGRRETSAGGFNFEEDLEPKPKNQLSDEQLNAVNSIFNSINEDSKQQNTSLFNYIYGPTGSGKTEVFLSLAEKVLGQGKGVIYLVPEISLTGQVAKSIVERFGNTAAVLHSGLTPSQKLAQWHKILHKEAKVIVGARSAIFAPVPDLGLIIIDEEHDGSYKSGTTPRYHARQVAMHRASQLKIPLIMGSATPSVEAWFQMNRGTIKRYNLTKRLAGGELPKVSCINLTNFQTEGCISKPLEDEIKATLENRKQATVPPDARQSEPISATMPQLLPTVTVITAAM
ncbi:MAG: primosomal protein N' [Treponema sp.]|nr:primosomal protein N' [Treponema sp.]